jgi:DNA polymerase sigma
MGEDLFEHFQRRTMSCNRDFPLTRESLQSMFGRHEDEHGKSTSFNSILDDMKTRMSEVAVSYSTMYVRNGSDPSFLVELDKALCGIFEACAPTVRDAEIRQRMVDQLSSYVENTVKGPIPGTSMEVKRTWLCSFGSFASGLYENNGDVDLSVGGVGYILPDKGEKPLDVIMSDREHRVHVLQKISKALPENKYIIKRIFRARVPLLKVFDREKKVHCDVCFGSREETALPKSQVMWIINKTDARFQILLRLVKKWGHHMNLKDASIGGFNSYTLAQLVIFHLQNRPVPALPPLRDIFDPYRMSNREWTCNWYPSGERFASCHFAEGHSDKEHGKLYHAKMSNIVRVAAVWQNRSKKNDETITELFISFLVFLRSLCDGKHFVEESEKVRISTFHGCMYCGENPTKMKKSSRPVFYVEDPFDSGDNSARAFAVNKKLPILMNATSKSLEAFQSSMKSNDVRSLMMTLGFSKLYKKGTSQRKPPQLADFPPPKGVSHKVLSRHGFKWKS